MFVIMKRAVMRKLILKFLDTKYPNAFWKKTKFGNLAMYGDEPIQGEVLIRELCDWFDVTQDFARHNLKVWISTLPVVVSIYNSTNPTVLVSYTMQVNSTL
jgi:hypothetical protein